LCLPVPSHPTAVPPVGGIALEAVTGESTTMVSVSPPTDHAAPPPIATSPLGQLAIAVARLPVDAVSLARTRWVSEALKTPCGPWEP
jgi:hypothetical protein